ncbi:ornithine--oxo-acid transaminase [bacterium]|nr:ornithine--oxo-acid transaminase [bacterium]
MSSTQEIIKTTEKYGAHNYHPLPVVLSKGKGIWLTDPEGKRYMDFLSAYSAVNQGHLHPRIISALKDQCKRLTLTSRAFHNDLLGIFLKELCEYTGYEMALPMNTGAEAVETAMKMARRWGVEKKGIKDGQQEIIVCAENFHGRTITIISFSTDPDARINYGPYAPGFIIIPYNDPEALRKAITPNTCAFLVEPIQGEAGVNVPDAGYLKAVRQICTKNNVLMIADEIQTGFCRTGKKFACDHENVKPDVMTLGKALGGGVFPVSAVVAQRKVMDVFTPGTHGSTFGGNPLACAVAREALRVLDDEKLADNAERLGIIFREKMKKIRCPRMQLVRGKGLLNAVVFDKNFQAWDVCVALKDHGLLAKQTHGNIIRFAPPLIITERQLNQAVSIIKTVFQKIK